MTNLTVAMRLNLRLNYRGLIAAMIAVIGCMYAGVRGLDKMYPTVLERATYASIANTLTSQQALQGPPTALNTLGGIAAFEVGWYVSIAVALVNIIVVVRNTRAQEALGRLELLRAGRFGAHANSVAVLIVSVLTNLIVGVGSALALIAGGAESRGAVAFGVAFACVGIVFAAIALLAAQLTEHARGAYGIACGVLGLAYGLRALGDTVDSDALRLLSPLGWAQFIHPFGQVQLWPILLCALVSGALFLLAIRIEQIRDYDAGLFRAPPGAPAAGPLTRTALGMVVRAQRAGLAMWVAALFGLGLGFGAAAHDAGEVAQGTQGMLNLLAGFNVDVVDGFLAMSTLLLTLAITGSTVVGVLQIRSEELAGRADLLLSGTLPKWRFVATHLAYALGSAVLLLVVTGLGLGTAHALRTGDPGQVSRLLGAALAQLPACVFLAGLGVFLVGILPRITWLAWVVLAESAVVSILGPSMKLSASTMNVSVFNHVSHLPGVSIDARSSLALTAAGALLALLGAAGFVRRDLD
ncbi:putative ABC transporter permease protein [Nocardia brasiliensis NBRC 14402]|uniref:ABC transporter permease n=1 Tax=Nocardia brasiliensis TaxID=37326 RepID=UPI0003071081|nr:hypothetical protein [Nocardia brasiliensis]ASF08077.1 hypothetical protein CEQ30_12685 [Nocardia brasiliensis]GAJ80944.1 putative ABC transporter permease protein [Nocardia brasiliensis NBRC 14402]SUB54281.1 Uncharacterised protein [Nocardia brasiliensis]